MKLTQPKKRATPPSTNRIRISAKPVVFIMIFVLWSTLLQACSPDYFNFSPSTPNPTEAQVSPTIASSEPLPEALIQFRVEIPKSPLPESGIVLSILDEVTGLVLNVQRYQMQAESPTTYSFGIPFPIGSVIKYRYSRQDTIPVEEHTSDGRPVRYRMYLVEGPGTVVDIVSRWTDTAFNYPSGRIQGKISEISSGIPVPSSLITAGGQQTLTASDGTFLIEGLPPGVHNLVAYSLDGSYQTFQQGAQIAADATTPAPIQVQRAAMVNITFNVTPPSGSPPAVPLRLAGNFYQLGNTFANLSGGVSTTAARMPALSALPDGNYVLTLSLPAGADLRYKYTLGDGFWNSEHTDDGNFILRQLIVPDTDTQINEKIARWNDTEVEYITFDVDVPASTPPSETISLQFNPYGWTEPIPMWSFGNNRWVYLVYSPLRFLSNLAYRYCRNDQCDLADDIQTIGPASTGRQLARSDFSQHERDIVSSWNWLETELPEPNPVEFELKPRQSSFMMGVEFLPDYHPTWEPKMLSAYDSVRNLNAGTVILDPTWTFARINPPVFEPVAGEDALWNDLFTQIAQAKAKQLQVFLFPNPRFNMDAAEWWSLSRRDFTWWVVWFERYRTFAMHHADLASRSGANALVLGGDWLTPALPGGTLLDGSTSGVPQDAEVRWRELLAEVREHYGGPIVWALPYTAGNVQLPGFLDAVDQVYILWSARLAGDNQRSREKLAAEASRLLDQEILPIGTVTGKQMIIGIGYPSADGGITGCIPDPEDSSCIQFDRLSPDQQDIPSITVDMLEQADVYAAMAQAVNERDWIVGLVTRGYQPAVVLHDKSTSIRGKPAEQILQAVYSGWLVP